jgi:hypothetical protein
MLRQLTGISLLLLAGCATTGGVVRPTLPPLPASAVGPCPLGAAQAGDDARVDAAKAYAAYGCEHGKRVAIITFYNGLKAGLK